jgi:hypothetical protein
MGIQRSDERPGCVVGSAPRRCPDLQRELGRRELSYGKTYDQTPPFGIKSAGFQITGPSLNYKLFQPLGVICPCLRKV